MQFTELEASCRCAARQFSRHDFPNHLDAGTGAIALAGMLRPNGALVAISSSPRPAKHAGKRRKIVDCLHLVGLDHERLTHRNSRRDYRLSDVSGIAAKDILS